MGRHFSANSAPLGALGGGHPPVPLGRHHLTAPPKGDTEGPKGAQRSGSLWP